MLREEITINQPGLTLRVGNKVIKTPANITLTKDNIQQVERQLINYGIKGKIFTNNTHRSLYKTPSNSLGCEIDPRDDRDYLFNTLKGYEKRNPELPGEVDYRDEMSSVKDQGNLGCHDEETEVFTDEGWKLFKDLNKNELLVTVNPKTLKIEYQKPTNYFEYDYNGKMYHFNHSQGLDALVTPNHKMFVREDSKNYDFIEAQSLNEHSKALTCPNWKCETLESIELPANYDLVDYNGKVYCAEVPNHTLITRRNNKILVSGNSCVAFGVSACKEYQAQKEYERELKQENYNYRRDRDEYDLSEQWLYHKTKEIDPWGYDTEGTSIRYALKVVQKHGIPPEKGWPYNDSRKGEPEDWAKLMARWQYCGNYFRIKTLDELLEAIHEYGPIPVGIVCFEEIFNPGENGYVPYPSNPQRQYGGHCVACVGFSQKGRVVYFKNSWGKNYGNNGFGLLPYRYIREFMLDAWVMTNIDISKQLFNEGR